MVLLLGAVGAAFISVGTDGWSGWGIAMAGGILMWLAGMQFEKGKNGNTASDSEPE